MTEIIFYTYFISDNIEGHKCHIMTISVNNAKCKQSGMKL